MGVALDMVHEYPWLSKDEAPYSNTSFYSKRPFFQVALHLNDDPLIDAMLDHGAPLERWDSTRRTALFLAMEAGLNNDECRESLAWRLIARGARCDVLNSSGGSLLYAHDGNYSRKLFNHLIAHGARLDCQYRGRTSISSMISRAYWQPGLTKAQSLDEGTLSQRKMRLEQCRWRIEAGADVRTCGESLTDHCLAKPLAYGDLSMADYLVTHGTDPCTQDPVGNTLMHALPLPAPAIAWLIDHGVDLEARNAWGVTPLAYQLDNLKTVDDKTDYAPVIALMVAGANLDAIDAQGPDVGVTPRMQIKAEKNAFDLQHACRAIEARHTAMRVMADIESPSKPKSPGVHA